jgi:hypothetical protein
MGLIYDFVLGALREQDSTPPTVIEQSTVDAEIDILPGNSLYVFSKPLNTLSIEMIEKSLKESNIIFTTAETITVSLPENVGIIGNMEFAGNKTYIISIKNNLAVSGEISYE